MRHTNCALSNNGLRNATASSTQAGCETWLAFLDYNAQLSCLFVDHISSMNRIVDGK